uniref:glutathione hydrolase 5 proenzyme-like n=1 Tax=Pristiophorus japonicus TaxID=55135 RepID=UPI00398F8361
MKRRCCCCLLVLLVAVLVVAGIVLILLWTPRCRGDNFYAHAAVAADSEICSETGRKILEQGGSAVDGAIAALLCSSLINPQSMGIGGGAIFTIYSASEDRVTMINAREVVPLKLKPSSLTGCGPYPLPGPGTQWIAVPGELQGYWEAHKRFGKLPWKSLFEPSIQLAEEGFRSPQFLRTLLQKLDPFRKNESLRSLFYHNTGELRDHVRYPQLAKTLKIIAEQGPDAFYSGKIGQDLIADIQEEATHHNSDGTLTIEDLKQYKALVMEPLNISLGDYVMYSPSLPAKGFILSFILNILKGFHFKPESMEEDQRVLTYHRIIEALKFGNGQLSRIKDPKVHPDTISMLLSDEFAESIRQRIDNQSHPPQYYNIDPLEMERYGTSHVSVLDKDGNAVSVTSSINHLFGSMTSRRTGIILNNQLADFCRADGSLPNIKAGQQPPSSMSPSILISKDKKSIMVVGGAGGSMILSATAQIVMNKLWFGLSMKDAIEKRRVHITSSNSVQFEEGFDARVVNETRQKGHNIINPNRMPSVIQGIFRDRVCIEAVSDSRKFGKSAGY